MPFVKSQMGRNGSGEIITAGDIHADDLTSLACLVDELNQLSGLVAYTRGGGSAVTALNFQLQASFDGTNWFNAPVNLDESAPPDTTVTPGKLIVAVSATVSFVLPPINIKTYPNVRWVVDHTGATAAGDLVTMTAFAEV
jgi:hypothetical protein